MMARLSHQNVLPVYEVGLAEDGAVFLVMEHIDGMDLAAWLVEPRTTAEIVDAFLQIARGLGAAHERGIVHRDIKPANVLVGRDGRVRVADFGLSRLTGRTQTGMVRIEDGLGTPGYMAPELWNGEPATPRSDVYALCVALLDALGERARELPARMREVIDAGTAADPAHRPELAQVIAALSGRRTHRRAWLIAAGAGAVAATLAVVLILRGDSATAPVCEVDATLLAGRYDAAQRAAVQASLAPRGDALGHAARDVIDSFDEQRRAIEDDQVAMCAAVRAGTISEAQRAARTACLTRRAFELTAFVERHLAAPDDLGKARGRATSLGSVGDCADMQVTPVNADRRAVEALWKRYIASEQLTTPTTANQHKTELTQIIERARELGEQELAIKAELWLAVEHKYTDQEDIADQVFQRAYQHATEIHAHELEIAALVQRSKLASWGRHDAAAARELADLARDAAKRPGTSISAQAAALHALGLAATAQGDASAAVKHLREGIAVLAKTSKHFPNLELNIRFALLDALGKLDMQSRAGMLALAKETAELSRTLDGESTSGYAIALNMVALAVRKTGDISGGLPYRRQAVAIMHKTMPAGSASIIGVHTDYASDLAATGDFVQARRELTWVIEQSRSNEMQRAHLSSQLALYSYTLFELGHFEEALAMADQALEESISRHGRDHPTSWDMRINRMECLIELGRPAQLARDIASLEQSYRTKPNSELPLIRLHGTASAALALARGKPTDAEALARTALAGVDELHGTDVDRAAMYYALGRALLAQKRWTEGRAAIERSIALYKSALPMESKLAALEVELARAEVGLGQRAAAVERVVRARKVLARYLGERIARAEADQILRRR